MAGSSIIKRWSQISEEDSLGLREGLLLLAESRVCLLLFLIVFNVCDFFYCPDWLIDRLRFNEV